MVQSWQHFFELLLFFLSLDKLHFPIPSVIKILLPREQRGSQKHEWIIFPPLEFFTNLEQRLRVTLKMVYHSGPIHFCKPHGNDQN